MFLNHRLDYRQHHGKAQIQFQNLSSSCLNSLDYSPHNLIYSVHKLRVFPPLRGKKESDNKSQSTRFNKIRYSCFKKQGEVGSCFFIVYRGYSQGKRSKNGFLPIKPPLSASNSIKGHNSVDLMPDASKMFLPKKSVFLKEQGKQYI